MTVVGQKGDWRVGFVVCSRPSLCLVLVCLLSACSTPTLVQVARRRQVYTDVKNTSLRGTRNVKDNVNVIYHLTDLDVLNFTDEVKRKLANRSSFHSSVRYGSSATQTTLGALAGAAKIFGWGVSTASGLGLGATYVFGLGHIFDTKGHAQAYEQAFTAIQAAEATYYFHQLGMGFQKEQVNGHNVLDTTKGRSRDDVPSGTLLTPDGESLYYRASKILKVLEDTLAAKIPDLQDLKEAHGESTGTSPAKSTSATPGTSPVKRTTDTATTTTTTTKTSSDPLLPSNTTSTPTPTPAP